MTWDYILGRIQMMTPADRKKHARFIEDLGDGLLIARELRIGRFHKDESVPTGRNAVPLAHFEAGDIYFE